MIAPMLNGFLARQTATEKSLRIAPSSRRISSVLNPNGATFTASRSVDGAELLVERVNRPLLEGERQHGAPLVLHEQREPREGDRVHRALHLVGRHRVDLAPADLEQLVAR